ncbi:MAG: serine hydrolase domain-containing protein [Planctomycetaceae bacterium]
MIRLLLLLSLSVLSQREILAEERAAQTGLAANLQPFVDGHTLAGAITLVADRDKVLDLSAVGFADIEQNRLMKTDDIVWIASMSKAITAAAVMVLVDEGKLSLDDPVEKHLPEFKNLWVTVEADNEHRLLRRPSSKITLRQVLCHTSGMPFRSDMEQPTLDALTLRECALSYAMTPLLHEPGSKYQYSNSGINTAGRIIEVVSGQPYETFLQERILDPLGMKDTTFWPSESQIPRIANAYTPNAEKTGLTKTTISQLTYPLNLRTRQPMPAGGLFSTATDVSFFCRMLLAEGMFEGKRVLSAEAVKQMSSRQTEPELPESYGLGLSVSPNSFGHGGALSTNMTIDKDRGLVLVYLVQHAGYANADGKEIQPTFNKAAHDRFGAKDKN